MNPSRLIYKFSQQGVAGGKDTACSAVNGSRISQRPNGDAFFLFSVVDVEYYTLALLTLT